jgi:hypothetical protein
MGGGPQDDRPAPVIEDDDAMMGAGLHQLDRMRVTRPTRPFVEMVPRPPSGPRYADGGRRPCADRPRLPEPTHRAKRGSSPFWRRGDQTATASFTSSGEATARGTGFAAKGSRDRPRSRITGRRMLASAYASRRIRPARGVPGGV